MKIMTTILTMICLSITAHGGWETAGLAMPQLYKTMLTCTPASKPNLLGVRYPTLVLNQNNNQWSVTSGVLIPSAPIHYSTLKMVKTVSAKNAVIEYYQTQDRLTKVKIVKSANQELVSAQVKNQILYNCQPTKATSVSESDSQVLFDILKETDNIIPSQFIEYTSISIKDVVCELGCTGTDENSKDSFKMTEEQSKLFSEILLKAFLINNPNNTANDGRLLTAKSINCSAGYDMGVHRMFSKCMIRW